MLFLEDLTLPLNVSCWLLFAGHSISAGVTNPLIQTVLQYVHPLVYVLVMPLQVALLSLVQYTLMYKVNPGKGNAVEISGVIVVLLGNVFGPLGKIIKKTYDEHWS